MNQPVQPPEDASPQHDTQPKSRPAAKKAGAAPSDKKSPPAKPPLDMRKIIFAVIIAAVIGGIIYFFVHQHEKNKEARELVLEGNVDIREVELGFRISGRITAMNFEEGTAVKKGTVLAVLDKAPVMAELAAAKAQVTQAEADALKYKTGYRPEEVAQAQANVAQAQAAFDNAQKFESRQKTLVNSGSISKQDYDNAVSETRQMLAKLQGAQEALRLQKSGYRTEDIQSAAAAVATAKARQVTAETSLADTEITAPSDGIIYTRIREPGAIVSAGLPVYTLTLHKPVWVRAYVDEPDLGRLKPNMEATVKTDTDSVQPLKGKIGFISPEAEFTPKNVQTRELRTDLVYRLRVLVDDPDGKLRQGMPVTVTIATPDGGPVDTSETTKP